MVCAPPCDYLTSVKSQLSPQLMIAAQNCWSSSGGSFTGEISAEMLIDVGASWVILGHSERRELCVSQMPCKESGARHLMWTLGNMLRWRNARRAHEGLSNDCGHGANFLPSEPPSALPWNSLAVAYEPKWAIGTGKVASPQQVQEVHLKARNSSRLQYLYLSQHRSASFTAVLLPWITAHS